MYEGDPSTLKHGDHTEPDTVIAEGFYLKRTGGKTSDTSVKSLFWGQD